MLTLFENIKITSGYLRSTVLDIGRNTFYLIPNGLYKIIQKYNRKDNVKVLDGFKKHFPNDYNFWIDFLMREELIFEVDVKQINCFTPLPLIF